VPCNHHNKELEGGFIAALRLIVTVLPVMLRKETYRLAVKVTLEGSLQGHLMVNSTTFYGGWLHFTRSALIVIFLRYTAEGTAFR